MLRKGSELAKRSIVFIIVAAVILNICLPASAAAAKEYSSTVVNPYQVYTYDRMEKDLKELVAMYPELLKLFVIGKTHEGRNIYALKMGWGKKRVVINGGHHAREWMTTNLVMKMIDEYAYYYRQGKNLDGYNLKLLLNYATIWFIPMVNPDGIVLVQEGLGPIKNKNQVLEINGWKWDFSGWKANIKGVDLNRQYDADWPFIKNSTAVPAPSDYKGPYPESESESRALADFTRKYLPEMTISYHSSGSIIFWYYFQEGSQYTRDLRLAGELGQITGYYPVPAGKDISGGGYKDWFIKEFGKPGFTIEIGKTINGKPLPIGEFYDIWLRNKNVGLFAASRSLSLVGYDYTVKQGDTLYGIALMAHVPLELLIAANPGVKAENLRVGRNIRVPLYDGYYTVKQGDTLHKIAAKFDITVKELVDKNGIENPDYVYPGMKLVVG